MSKINFAFLSTNLVCTKQAGKGGVLVGCSAANYESLGWQVDVFFKFNCIFIWHQPTLTPTIEELHVLEYRTYNNIEKTPVILYQETVGRKKINGRSRLTEGSHLPWPAEVGEMRRESKQAERTETTNRITNPLPHPKKTWGYSFKPADEVLQNWRYMQKSAEKYVWEHSKNQTRDTKVKSSSGAI